MTAALEPLLSRVLMPGVTGVETEDRGQPVELHPQEAVIVAQAGEKRRREFALGRFCAHAALLRLGRSQDVIGRGTDGAPQWPRAVRGSITHTTGYAAALVAPADRFAGIGVDAEHVGGVTEKLWPRLFDAGECAMLAGLDEMRRAIAATILFSAKEACLKAQGAGPFSFMDIHVALTDNAFRAHSKVGEMHGLSAVGGTLVVTAAYLPSR